MRRAGDITILFTAALFGGLSRGIEILALVIHSKSGCTRCQESSALLVLFLSQGIYHTDVMLPEDTDY